MKDGIRIGGVFKFICKDVVSGRLKWQDEARNLIVDEGCNHLLDVLLHGTTQVDPWYLGLKLTGTVAAGDTYASHAGWTEFAEYSGDRKEYVEGAAASRQITNSGSVGTFDITSAGQVYGGLLCSIASKDSATGTLLCAADISSSRTVDSGDQINVTYTITASGA